MREFSLLITSNPIAMYTLRHTYMLLGSSLGLTKSGVRWLDDAEMPMTLAAKDTEVDDLIRQARERLQSAPNKYADAVTLNREVNGGFFVSNDTVRGLLKKIIAINKDKKEEIDSLITTALNSPDWNTSEKQKILQALRSNFDADFQTIEAKRVKEANQMKATTGKETSALKSSVVDTHAQTVALKKILASDSST